MLTIVVIVVVAVAAAVANLPSTDLTKILIPLLTKQQGSIWMRDPHRETVSSIVERLARLLENGR